MKKGLGVLVIAISICVFFAPAGMGLRRHALEYGWPDVFKNILIPVLSYFLLLAIGGALHFRG